MLSLFFNVLYESWLVLGEMAPYLFFGFAAAGLFSVWISPEWTERHMGGRGLRPVVEAALWGVPLPLCSCSVIPVAASMRRHGATRAATTAFLLSTPQTGVDSIAVTLALLGPVFAVFRPITALVSGILGGMLVLLLGQSRANGNGLEADSVPACTEACCRGDRSRGKLFRALRYGFVTLPSDLAIALLVGVVAAGAIAALMPRHELTSYLGGGLMSILLLMAAGVPVYVCATASVPIAAGLIHAGASPGAAMAFLIVGPATNPAALATLWKVLGRRSALLYLFAVALSAIACGLLLDAVFLLPAAKALLPHLPGHAHAAESLGGWSSFWAAGLLALLVFSYIVSRWPRGRAGQESETSHEPEKPCCCCSSPTNPHTHFGT